MCDPARLCVLHMRRQLVFADDQEIVSHRVCVRARVWNGVLHVTAMGSRRRRVCLRTSANCVSGWNKSVLSDTVHH
jgi:hypothetical protein